MRYETSIVNNVQIRWSKMGSGACNVIFTPGARGTISDEIFHVSIRKIPQWEDVFTVYLWDRRNSGGSEFKYSSSQRVPESIQDASDLQALLDVWKIGSAVLVGSSSGARVSVLCATSVPHRVAGLVIINPSAGKVAATEVARTYYENLAYRVAEAGACTVLAEVDQFERMLAIDPAVYMKLHQQDFDDFLGFMSANSKWIRSHADTVPMLGVPSEKFTSLQRTPALVLHTAGMEDRMHPRFAAHNVASMLPLAPPAILCENTLIDPLSWQEPLKEFLETLVASSSECSISVGPTPPPRQTIDALKDGRHVTVATAATSVPNTSATNGSSPRPDFLDIPGDEFEGVKRSTKGVAPSESTAVSNSLLG